MSQTISGNLSVSGSSSLTSVSCGSLTATTATVSTLNATNLNATISQLTVPQLITNNIMNSQSISTPQLLISTKNIGTAVQTLEDKNVLDRQNIQALQTKTTNVNYNTTSLTTTINGSVDIPNTVSVNNASLTGSLTLTGTIQVNNATIAPSELSYLDNCTSNIQTQINNTNANILSSSIKIANLESINSGQSYSSSTDTTTIDNNVVITKNLNLNGNLNVNGSTISPTELSYLDNCASNVQTQVDNCQTQINNCQTQITACQNQANSNTSRITTIETNYGAQLAKIPGLETKLTDISYVAAQDLTLINNNVQTSLDFIGSGNQSQLRNLTVSTDSINCYNVINPTINLFNNVSTNSYSSYPLSVKIGEILVPRNVKVTIGVVSPFAFFGFYSSGTLPQTQSRSLQSGFLAILVKRSDLSIAATTSNISFSTATNSPTTTRSFTLSSASSTYEHYVNNAYFTCDIPLSRWTDEIYDIHLDLRQNGIRYNCTNIGQTLVSCTSSINPESSIYVSKAITYSLNSLTNNTTGTVQLNSLQCNSIYGSGDVNVTSNLVYPNTTKTIIAPACATPAWIVNAGSADMKINNQYPIMCSLKKLGKIDDYFIVAPGYKLLLYSGLVYTGSLLGTIDNTLGVTFTFRRSVDVCGGNNMVDSCRLYYYNTEITVPEWST